MTATFFLRDAVGQGAALGNVLLLSFVHYWFLHAILLVLVGFALLETLLRRPAGPLPLLALTSLLFALPTYPIPVLQLANAHYLAPYFLLGVLLCRNLGWIQKYRKPLLAMALVATAVGVGWNLLIWSNTGRLSLERRDIQSIVLSVGAIITLLLLAPRVNWLKGFGAFAFTIYLYHVFGTAGMRRAAEMLGLESTPILFLVTTAGGIAIPVLFHLACARSSALSTVILGSRPRSELSREGRFAA